jgi:hypothetical protein
MVDTAFSKDTSSAIPGGQSKGVLVDKEDGISADIFGRKGGRFHPFLLFEEIYTDNLFATHTNKKNDFITSLAPGIWLAFPANREKLLSIDTTTTSPGGLKLSRIKPEATRRYQTYFLYSPEFVFYSNNANQNHTNHKAEGLLQYNFNSGLSLDLIDLFHIKEEVSLNGVEDTLYRHQDNLLNFIATYDTPSDKFKLAATYSNYDINYKDTIVSYRDRTDNSFGVSLFYKIRPKTSVFGEYDYSDIDFNSESTNNSVENRYYAGVQWDMTAKTRGTLKIGYMDKDFDVPSVEDQSGLSLELQTQINLSPKRAIQVNGYRKFQESDIANASSFLSTGIDIGLLQRFSRKWTGDLSFTYERNNYNGSGQTDDLIGFGPTIRFKARQWLIFDLGYSYSHNNSNLDFYSYTVHQIFFRATLSL